MGLNVCKWSPNQTFTKAVLWLNCGPLVHNIAEIQPGLEYALSEDLTVSYTHLPCFSSLHRKCVMYLQILVFEFWTRVTFKKMNHWLQRYLETTQKIDLPFSNKVNWIQRYRTSSLFLLNWGKNLLTSFLLHCLGPHQLYPYKSFPTTCPPNMAPPFLPAFISTTLLRSLTVPSSDL